MFDLQGGREIFTNILFGIVSESILNKYVFKKTMRFKIFRELCQNITRKKVGVFS